MDKTRVCKTCGETKPVAAFHTFRRVCRPCYADYKRDRMATDEEWAAKIRAQGREYYRRNKKRILAKYKKIREAKKNDDRRA